MKTKNKNLEIEIRGPLARGQYKRLALKIAREHSIVLQEVRQIVIFYKKNNKDFRIKWDKNKTFFEFVYKSKKGTQRTIREELVVKIDKKEINDFLTVLDRLGLKRGFISPNNRIDIATPLVIWSFKTGAVIGDYWEAEATKELLTKFKNEKDKIKNYLEDLARRYGLSVWDDIEFRKIRKEKWHNVEPLKNSQIVKLLAYEKY